MKSIAVIPIEGRIDKVAMTIINCFYLKIDVCVIASNHIDIDNLNKLFAKHIDDNQLYIVLSKLLFPAKIDEGLQFVSTLDYDSILMIGCDDILSAEDYDIMINLLQHHDAVAFSNCYMIDDRFDYVVEWPGYPMDHTRYGEPAGAFRLIKRKVFDTINWTMYDCTQSSMDAHSWSLLYNCALIKCHYSFDIKDANSMTQLYQFNYLEPVSKDIRLHIMKKINELRKKYYIYMYGEGVGRSLETSIETPQP
jgi:hypothetical protein